MRCRDELTPYLVFFASGMREEFEADNLELDEVEWAFGAVGTEVSRIAVDDEVGLTRARVFTRIR
jgi:hypothetical protein